MDVLSLFLMLAAFVAPLLLLWMFVRRDQARIENSKPNPIPREQMRRGFVPGQSTRWIGAAGIALMGLIGAVSQFLAPSLPPFSGRWSWFLSLWHAALGTYGLAFFWTACAAAFAAAAWGDYKAASKKPPR